MKFSIVYFIWWTVNISIKSYISVPEPESVFMLTNSADPYAAFHIGLPCLQKDLFTDIQNKKRVHLGAGLTKKQKTLFRS